MVLDTTDVRSHGDEQILKAADYLAGSEVKQFVFEEIYLNKHSGKTAKEIANNIFSKKHRSLKVSQVLDAARALAGHGYIGVTKSKGCLTFVKVAFFMLNKTKILGLAKDMIAREKLRVKIYGSQLTVLKIKKPDILSMKQSVVRKQSKGETSKMSMDVAKDDWDVFICYKRISAEDLAVAVKKILEEYEVHAFLDIKDIPSRFKGTEAWFDARDNAIKKCKTFILLMTAGFERSEEIKKELTIARSVPDKLFSYFRHENLSTNQIIALKSETVDLGKQQQFAFGTQQDLVRKVHKIIVTEGQPDKRTQKQNGTKQTFVIEGTAPISIPPTTQTNGGSLEGSISSFAAFYNQTSGSRQIQKVYPKLFSPEEMTSLGKASKICRVLETFEKNRTQLRLALQTIINLHIDYSNANIDALKDTVNGFGFNVTDKLLVTEKEVATGKSTEEIVREHNEAIYNNKAIYDKESSEPLPYLACPRCGNKNLQRSSTNFEDDYFFFIECPNCHWSDET